MHIRHLFTRYDHARRGDYLTYSELPAENHRILATLSLFVVVIGFLATVAVSLSGDFSFANPFVRWGWVMPSIIMTPFIIWRIVSRACIKDDGLTFGNFVSRHVYIPTYGFTFLHVLMYVALAYLPFVNLVCVLAGAVSIARCNMTTMCPSRFSRTH